MQFPHSQIKNKKNTTVKRVYLLEMSTFLYFIRTFGGFNRLVFGYNLQKNIHFASFNNQEEKKPTE